jgi:hypothetical protein
MKVTTLEVNGAKYPVDCNEAGEFGTNVKGDWLKAPSLDLLRKKLQAKARLDRAKIAIPVWIERGGEICHGTITGIHSRTRHYLITWEDGTKEQDNSWRDDYMAIDVKDLPKARQLFAAVKDAQKAWDKFEKDHLIHDLKALVAAAAGLDQSEID